MRVCKEREEANLSKMNFIIQSTNFHFIAPNNDSHSEFYDWNKLGVVYIVILLPPNMNILNTIFRILAKNNFLKVSGNEIRASISLSPSRQADQPIEMS